MEDLAAATGRLTRLVSRAGQIEPGHDVLDIGCGTGAPACFLTAEVDARVTGITTSEAGIRAARARASTEGLGGIVSFAERDEWTAASPPLLSTACGYSSPRT